MTLQESMDAMFAYKEQVYDGSQATPKILISDLKMEVWRILFRNQIGNFKLKREVT